MSNREILLVAGARPNFMKIAPILHALNGRDDLTGTLLHTGQHYDRRMSDLFFRELGLPEPEIHLGVGSSSHAVQTARIMMRIEEVLLERRPGAVLVVGDVNSTIAAALVAVKLGIPVIHVEAGLRSFDRSMPEEINRILTDSISDWLFVTERSGMVNLQAEGIPEEKVHLVGNVMIDTLLRFRHRAEALDVPGKLGLDAGAYALMTLHRPSNVDGVESLAGLMHPIVELSRKMPVVFPVHPRTRKTLRRLELEGRESLRLMEPLGYLEFLGLMSSAGLVLTDSGGIQEETTVLGVPCITLRESTERPVTVEQGTNRLAGTDPERIRRMIDESLEVRSDGRVPDLWDGKAAERIVSIISSELCRMRV